MFCRTQAAVAPPKSKVGLDAAIRLMPGVYRALIREHGVGFRAVKAALESVWPELRKAADQRRVLPARRHRGGARTGRHRRPTPADIRQTRQNSFPSGSLITT